jgi:diguanylate cyclase (GGDEF)-like protein
MAGMASWLLLSFLHANFNELEEKQSEKSITQLMRNFDAELSHLASLNSDWAHWDALYFFAQSADPQFAQDELTATSLQSAQVNLMAVFNAGAELLIQQAYDLQADVAVPTDRYAPAIGSMQAVLKQAPQSSNCGLFNLNSDTLMLCWQPITRGDLSGEYVGSVLMGRLLDARVLERMRTQSAIDFQIEPLTSQGSIHPEQTFTSFTELHSKLNRPDNETVTVMLSGLTGEPALQVLMHYSRDISRNAEQVIRWVMSTLMLIVILSAVTLILGVNRLLVWRINALSSDLNHISANNEWAKRVIQFPGNDELSSLSRDTNQLLSVIETQVHSLEALTLTDPLTKIANRRAFDQRLTMEMDISARSGAPLALLALDVDFFKLYNDNYGHPAGDSALQVVAEVMQLSASRPSDLAARLGGEEFAILLPNTGLAGAEALAKRLCATLSQRNITHAFSAVADHLTVSVGVTIAGNESTYSLVARADNAVYQSKSNGRNRVTALPPPSEQSLYEITLSD